MQRSTSSLLDAFDATRLFVQCARRRQPDFAPDDDEAILVVELCRQLEGMPLAIELAAAWLRSLPLRALAAEVDRGLQRLETPLRDMPARHRSMTAVFDPSWRLLNEREQAILRALSVFRGGFTEDAAKQVAGAELADLGSLADASWLRVASASRYDMHELVRQYCAARLEDAQGDDAAEEVRGRHCAYFGEFLNLQTGRINYQAEVMADLMAEFGNLQAAWLWAVEHGQMAKAHAMFVGVWFVGDMQGRYHFTIQSFMPIISRLERIVHEVATPAEQRSAAAVVLAWMEYAQGELYLYMGLVEQAQTADLRSRAAALLLEDGDAREELLLVCDQSAAWILYTIGDIVKAKRLQEARRRRIERMTIDYTLYGAERGRKFWLGHTVAALAICTWYQGDYAGAEDQWQQAIALREEIGEQRCSSYNLCDYALTCVTTGRYDEALELARQGLAFSQAFGDLVGIGYGQMTLGIICAARGQTALAAQHLRHSLDVGRQSGHLEILMRAAVDLGRLALAQGRLAEAQAYLDEAMDAATRNTALPYVDLPEVLIGLGLTALARGEHESAAGYFQQVLQQSPHCAAWHVPEARLGLAKVHLAQGQLERTHDILRQVADDPAAAASTRAEARQLLWTRDAPYETMERQPDELC